MATQAHTAFRPAETILGLFGDVTEDNDRVAQIEVRPGMSEGQHLALILRCWGHGHWCVAQGRPSHFTCRRDAEGVAHLWVARGRTN